MEALTYFSRKRGPREDQQVLRKQSNIGPAWLTGALGAKRVGVATTEILDGTLEPGISNVRPVAVFRSLDHHKGDGVRLRVTKRGQWQPDRIATYRVIHEASERYPPC